MKMNYAELIRTARKEKGWSQQRLAEELNTKQSVIARYENGKAPSPNTWMDIKKVLEIKEDPTEIETKTPPSRKDDGGGDNWLHTVLLRPQAKVDSLEEEVAVLKREKGYPDDSAKFSALMAHG